MKKILIIEDDIYMAEQENIVLQREGYEVLLAKKGNEGLNRALSEHPDLIVLDVILPDMNGKDILDMLRADPWGANVPIILYTNLDLSEKEKKEFETTKTALYFLKVDVTTLDLVKKIKEILPPTPAK